MPSQMTFDLPARPALGRGDFYVTDSNEVALGLIDTWPRWPGGKLLLVGPHGSGKTHLAHVWSAESGGTLLASRDLAQADVAALSTGPVCVEDVERLAGDAESERALFHLHNHVLAQDQTLLLTATTAPATWGLELPDLASRMIGTTLARMAPPDDLLLSAVLAKLFADRQIVPFADVIPYLVRWMPRSFAAAGLVVAHLDKAALGTPKGVTRNLARMALAELEFPDETAAE